MCVCVCAFSNNSSKSNQVDFVGSNDISRLPGNEITEPSSNDHRPGFSKFLFVISITLLSTLTGDAAVGPRNKTTRTETQTLNRFPEPNFMKHSRPAKSLNNSSKERAHRFTLFADISPLQSEPENTLYH
ncbi:hypothetical protein T02_5356 [Trichinella nativa]|uniref:Uncharacterized protein n=1 Tax=Trichinella nativa TaxID=6335 RepID=A0A0V1L4K3_9BILA|nr:hypothetical protein T02_5356 [Trichinella nativa]